MKSISRIISVIIILFVSELTAQNNNESGTWEPLMQAVENILAGKSNENDNIIVSPDAYLVCGNSFENLNSVLSGEIINCSLKEDDTRGGASIVVRINDSDNAGYLMLKTQTIEKTEDRFHTVIFMKNSSDKWVIHAWHTSN